MVGWHPTRGRKRSAPSNRRQNPPNASPKKDRRNIPVHGRRSQPHSGVVVFSERAFDSGGPRLRDVGESEMLRRLQEVSAPGAAGLPLGPGDDAAVWAPPMASEVALSQDALVEDRDFRRAWLTPRALGRRALAVALSDLAAMGATPAWCMATLCAPGETEVEDVVEIQSGLVEAAIAAGCVTAGGDLSDIPRGLVIDVAVGGIGAAGRWLRRDAGRPGDALLVTGTLGGAAAGLRVLQGLVAADAEDALAWVAAWRAPRARLDEGRYLAAVGVRCAGDISDGLVVDAARTAAASGCAAELWLDAVPVEPGIETAFPGAAADLALAGGEDFELLCAVAPVALEGLFASWPGELAPLRHLGRLVEGAGVLLLDSRGGTRVPLPSPASRHWG